MAATTAAGMAATAVARRLGMLRMGLGLGRLGLGLYFATLPLYYNTYWWGGVPYYYADNTYYVYDPNVRTVRDRGSPGRTAGPGEAAAARRGERPGGSELIAYPKNGQTADQQAKDKFECHEWAVGQSGFDPTTGAAPHRRPSVLTTCGPKRPAWKVAATASNSRRSAGGSPSRQLQRAAIDAMQPLDIGDAHAFVRLVDGRVDDAELDHLRAHRRDESAVRGPAAGREFRADPQFLGSRRGIAAADSDPGRGQERVAGNEPFERIIDPMPRKMLLDGGLQRLDRLFGRESQIEPRLELARDHVRRARPRGRCSRSESWSAGNARLPRSQVREVSSASAGASAWIGLSANCG